MQHFRCHRKRRQVCSFLSLVRREGAGRWRLLNTKVTTNFSGWLCFALCFQCSISLDKSSFQISESRSDVSAVGHLWCLIHLFCNFWLKAFVKEASPRCLHAILCSSQLWFLVWVRMATSVLEGRAPPRLAVHHIGSLSTWLLPQVQQETRAKCLQLDNWISTVKWW